MSAHLWSYFLQDDVESFQQLLGEAVVSGRTNASRSIHAVQAASPRPAVGSPLVQASSPPYTPRAQADGLASSTTQPAGFRDIILTKADLNKRDGKGMTLLHHAASSRSTNALTFALALLSHPHTDIFLQDHENGWTALHRAFYAGNITIARAIIDRESQNILGQGGPAVSPSGPSLIKVKDKEGHGPYDLYVATICDRSLHHNVYSVEAPQKYRLYVDQEAPQDISDDELDNQARDHQTLLADGQGDELFTFGSNRNITLGFGDEDDRLRPERVKLRRPTHLFQRFHREHFQNRAEEAFKISQAYGEKLQAQALLPSPLNGLPSVIRSRPMVIQDVQMAKFHTTVLTSDPVSNLYVCGHGPGGRLGTGTEKTQFTLVCLEDFASQRKRIVAVAPGQDHTLAVTEQGELFTWGSNLWGQLGCGLPRAKAKPEETIQPLPKQLFGSLKRELVVGVAASAIHSVAHTATDLFTFGRNAGQLGLVDSGARSLEAQGTPRNVTPSRFSSNIRSVSAIDKATICLLDSFEVFIFANFGCTRIEFLLDHFSNYFLKSSFLTTKYDSGPRHICKITSGGDTVCALSTAGEVYALTVKQAIDPSSAITTSTTNPNKIKAGLSAPSCVWSLKKDSMAARDVGVDSDGSIIICTEAGSVWRRVLRPKAAGASSTQRSKDYKFSRVPNLTRVIAVRASAAGAFCAIRQECDVTKTQIVVAEQRIWKDVFGLLSFGAMSEQEPSGKGPGPASFWRRPSHLQRLIANIKSSQDVEQMFAKFFSDTESHRSKSCDIVVSSTLSEVKIPAHRSILTARSAVARAALSVFQATGEYASEHFTVRSDSTHEQCEIQFQGIDFLTLAELVLYLYTDSFIGFWNLARDAPQMAFRYRSVRNELMKTAARLELRNLETAARRMLPSGEASLSADMELAVADMTYFQTGDALVLLADGEFLVHSDLLARRCPFFEGLFRGRAEGRWLAARRSMPLESDQAVEVDLKHIELSIFQLVLRYLYADTGPELFDEVVTQDLDEFLDIVMEVLSVANELMLDRLSQICQQVLGRHVTTRNICQLLNAVSPCSETEFKDVGLEYLCLNLEAVLSNHWLDELDEDLLLELDDRVRENQLSLLPIARSGRAEAELFHKYPELAQNIDRARQAKLDALKLQSKFLDHGIPFGGSFEAYDEDWLSSPPLKPRRSRASRGSSASTTPKMKAKAKAFSKDIDDELAAGLPNSSLLEPDMVDTPQAAIMQPSPSFTPQDMLNSPRTSSPSVKDKNSFPPVSGSISALPPQTPRAQHDKANALSSSPWGSSPLSTAKLGMKEIMSQASSSSPSNISIGLSKNSGEGTASISSAAKISQKERKKQQRQLGEAVIDREQTQMMPKSPWQTVSSYSKPSLPSLNSGNATGPKPGEQSRSVSTPHLTMRQTVANASAGKHSQNAKPSQPQLQHPGPSSPPRQAQRSSSSSAVTPSTITAAIPIRSVRHTPRPISETSPDAFMHQSLADIIHQEQAGKDAIKEAVATRSLQEIQQEQEFLEWWDHQSRMTQEAEAAQRTEASSSTTKSKGSGNRGYNGGGGGGGGGGSSRRRRGGGQNQGRKASNVEH